ncbi:mitochondrial import inner membrane translocase subunit Tim8-like protein [Dinothrombium tinctorium]|uniref:Mitochondrial import inner membrane translocase subunit n=1 Tax=Dinothrombium tinctorium TaxID=1965070 RepID=A0A443QRH1_9ACAR|nr:mitochondrial import inner membrane translocase subunit Tim8-like protein [Dinothrombium tinctorium]
MSSNDDLSTQILDKDLQEFILAERQKAQFQAQVHRLNSICWDKCVTDKPSSKLDSRTEACLSNCVDRFIDTSLAITQRFANIIQKQASQSFH